MEGNSSSASSDTSHFHPGGWFRQLYPSPGLNQSMGTPIKQRDITVTISWGQLITFQHHFSDIIENRISWGARFGVGYEVRRVCIQPGTLALLSLPSLFSLYILRWFKMKQPNRFGQCLTVHQFVFCSHDLAVQAAHPFTLFCCICVSLSVSLLSIWKWLDS